MSELEGLYYFSHVVKAFLASGMRRSKESNVVRLSNTGLGLLFLNKCLLRDRLYLSCRRAAWSISFASARERDFVFDFLLPIRPRLFGAL